MSGRKRPPTSDQPSITYRWDRIRGASSDLGDFVHKEHVPSISDNREPSSKKSEPMSCKILSTEELISAVGQIWNLVSPPTVFEHKEKLNQNGIGCQKIVTLGDLGGEKVRSAPTLDDDAKYYCVDVRTASHIAPMMQPKFEFLKVTQKMSVFEPCSENYAHPLFWQFLKGATNLSNEPCMGKRLANLGITYELEKIYGWMKKVIPAGHQYLVNIAEIEKNKTGKSSISGSAISNAGCISRDAIQPTNNLASKRADFYFGSIKSRDASLCDNTKVATRVETTSSLYSDYFLGALQDNGINVSVAKTPSSSLHADYFIDFLAPYKSTYEKFLHNTDDNEVSENKRKQPQKFVIEDKNGMEIRSPAHGRPQCAFAKQEHAFAGAFAGIFVSLCLHPIDTVKTVIQSCHAEQKSIYYIGRSIVSERGKF